jgi:tRNA pseudouridine38-40 synthase
LSTERIRLTVAYDGYDFCGWAPQRGQRTVHGTLTEAIRRVSGEEIEIAGASRTDSGAHAKGQVCHFDTEAGLPPEKWLRALNDRLPPDVKVAASRRVPQDFDSRFWAQSRSYRYRIQMGDPDPHRSRYTHQAPYRLDVGAMSSSAKDFLGEHDFRSYSQELEPEKNSVREIYAIQVRQVRDEVWIDVEGSAFVRGMMRRISGALFEIGRGRWDPESAARLLQRPSFRNDGPAGIELPPVLPAHGLCLMRVRYGRHPRDHRLLTIDPLSKDLPQAGPHQGEDSA